MTDTYGSPCTSDCRNRIHRKYPDESPGHAPNMVCDILEHFHVGKPFSVKTIAGIPKFCCSDHWFSNGYGEIIQRGKAT